jgi:hypothetical protein
MDRLGTRREDRHGSRASIRRRFSRRSIWLTSLQRWSVDGCCKPPTCRGPRS